MYVEVLISMVLLGFVLIATAPMFVLAGRENAAAADQTFATTLAHDRAEAMKRMGYWEMTTGSDVVKQRSVSYQRSWVVELDKPHAGMRTVTVTVTPQRAKGHGGKRIAKIAFYRAP